MQQQDASRISLIATSRQRKDICLGSNAVYPKLEIDDSSSIAAFAESLAQRDGKVDVLINNAGTYLDSNYSKQNVKKTLDVNYRGTLDVSALSTHEDVAMQPIADVPDAHKMRRLVPHANSRTRCVTQ